MTRRDRARLLVVLLIAFVASAALVVHEILAGAETLALVLTGFLVAVIGLELGDRYLIERRLRREATETESRLGFVVEQAPVVVYVADPGPAGRWHFVSPHVEQLLGFTPQQFIADPSLWRHQTHPDDLPLAMSDERRVLESGRANATDYRIRTRDGSERWVRDIAMPGTEHGRPVIQGVIYDITELKRSEATARDREAMLRELVGEKTREVERSRLETLQRLAIAAELHEEGTREHTLRVGRSAAWTARALGLNPTETELISQAAALHDIGKLGVSNTILLKSGPLTESEQETMQQHCWVGATILEGSENPVLRMAESVALTHHERWDGEGYPRGLSGEEIPIAGRITAVVDVFDALTHTRPYKESWPPQRALDEIRAGAGSRFDPTVVEAFLSLDTNALLTPIEIAAVA